MQKQKKYLAMQKLKSLRIDWRRKRVDKDDDNNNINFSGGNDNDDEGGSGDNQSQWKFNNLRYNPDSGDNNELICRYNDLRQPIFWDVPPSPLSPLERPTIQKDYDDTFFTPPQIPNIEDLKTNFDGLITNLIDKANNVIEMIPKILKKEDNNLYLSEQLSKLFPEVNVQGKTKQGNNENIGDLPIKELTEILSKTDKGEITKQLNFFEGKQNTEFESKVKWLALSTNSIKFLQSRFC